MKLVDEVWPKHLEDLIEAVKYEMLAPRRRPRLHVDTCMPNPVRVVHDIMLREYGVVGNTQGYDLLQPYWEDEDADVAQDNGDDGSDDTWRVLLADVWDVRNVMETAVGWMKSRSTKGLSFVLADDKPSVLVRDLLLLEVTRSSANSVEALLDMWSSLGIRREYKSELVEAMEKLYNKVAGILRKP